MRGWFAVIALAAAGCGSGGTPDIIGLTDQVAIVGTELVVHVEGVDPDGDRLEYSVEADFKLDGAAASMSQTPDGQGVFRWTPMPADVGFHAFDFRVTDGESTQTVSIQIEVRATAAGIPVFREPRETGQVYDLGADPCVTVGVMIEDDDSSAVTITEVEPLIEGATLMTSGLTATWRWCPTSAQLAATNRYTLTLSADDGVNPPTIKPFVIVLGSGTVASTLIINEVDYDQISTDAAEYIEIYNASGTILSLAGLKVSLVNGATNVPYQTIDLGASGQLAIGQYLIIAGAGVTVPTSAKRVNPLWSSDQVQNGAPDGIAIIDDVTHTVIDALSYEGEVTAAMLPGFTQAVSLVEGSALAVTTADSNTATMALCRIPSGEDTNNAATDWTTCTTLSVGKKNL
jgi:hypothetical protein